MSSFRCNGGPESSDPASHTARSPGSSAFGDTAPPTLSEGHRVLKPRGRNEDSLLWAGRGRSGVPRSGVPSGMTGFGSCCFGASQLRPLA
jgi:hypothetical protein